MYNRILPIRLRITWIPGRAVTRLAEDDKEHDADILAMGSDEGNVIAHKYPQIPITLPRYHMKTANNLEYSKTTKQKTTKISS